MSDELLPYYNNELAFFRRMGAEFAERNPKIAARLRLGQESSEDPHVERMIQAFAYLNARIRRKLDDDFPELTDAILGILYPHYLRPIPSMAIVQFELDRGQGELTTGYRIARGSELETERIDGEPCRFRTGYPVTLWPMELVDAAIQRPPFQAPTTRYSPQARSLLKLKLRCISKDMTIDQLDFASLRFFLKGQYQYVHELYEFLLNNVSEIAVAKAPDDDAPAVLKPEMIQSVGFGTDEGLIPFSNRSFLGYRIVSEYFAFPEKFLFVDLNGLDPAARSGFGSELEIYIFFNRSSSNLEQNVSEDTFRLGCAPVVNLFRQRAEPIQLTQTQSEYRIVPDARRSIAMEVFGVDRVHGSSPSGEEREFQPFFSVKHSLEQKDTTALWQTARRWSEKTNGPLDLGTEVYVSLVDLEYRPSAPADWTLLVETTCLNRDLPSRLPFGGGQPKLHLSAGGPLSRIECLTPPTSTLRPPLKHAALWRLISHLSLNYLSIGYGDQAAEALREILTLYDYRDSDDTRAVIAGIHKISSRRVVGRAGGPVSGGFCRGVEVTVELDPERFTGTGLFLFATVLERFLGMYCSINSFSQLIVRVKGREGTLRRWQPRAGEQILV